MNNGGGGKSQFRGLWEHKGDVVSPLKSAFAYLPKYKTCNSTRVSLTIFRPPSQLPAEFAGGPFSDSKDLKLVAKGGGG